MAFYQKNRRTIRYLFKGFYTKMIINGARQIGKNFTNFRAIPKLVDENGTYKLRKDIIFSNENITKKENNLYYYPIYQIMFI